MLLFGLRRALLKGNQVIHSTVTESMTSNPHTIAADCRVSVAEAYMLENKIRALMVVDPGGAIVGVVDTFDGNPGS
ncbi:CBS domain-containing protein [Pseudomonas juntendi]|uniref:CBS domain-containing protein n=1 Tax=Pseudomonas juntendi TaxID=2666183 RepID=UPI0021754150|nr:CBS domain-containing protein [Pseudomonas juntendi]